MPIPPQPKTDSWEKQGVGTVRTIRPRKIKRPGYHQDPSWADVQDYFSGPIPPVDHVKALQETGWLTKVQLAMWIEGFVVIDPKELIRVLNRAGVKFVLMGAHVTNAWSRVHRATRDVDVLVQKSHHRKAVQAIHRAYPTLQPEDRAVVTRFRDPADDQIAIDVMKPTDEIHKAAMKHTVRVDGTHDVPKLEMLLACKFAALTSPNRQRVRKMQDAVDFTLVLQHNKDDIKRERLHEFGEFVYAGGGDELVKIADEVLAGRMLVF